MFHALVHENEIEKVAVQKIMLKEVIQNHAQWKDKQIKSTEIMKEVNIETEMNSDKESHEVNEQNILPSNLGSILHVPELILFFATLDGSMFCSFTS
jgi:hypothetical protein